MYVHQGQKCLFSTAKINSNCVKKEIPSTITHVTTANNNTLVALHPPNRENSVKKHFLTCHTNGYKGIKIQDYCRYIDKHFTLS